MANFCYKFKNHLNSPSFINHQTRIVSQGRIQLGTFFEEKGRCWSEEFSIPGSTSDSRSAPTADADDTVSVSVAFVLSSGEIRGASWSVTCRLFRGIKIVSVEQRFQIINNVGTRLLVYPALLATGKKVRV